MRRPNANEHIAPFGGTGSAAAQIAEHRFTDVRRQQQPLRAVCFTSHDKLSGAPVDIVQTELRDLARTQP